MDAARGSFALSTHETSLAGTSQRQEALRADLVSKSREAAPAETLTEAERNQAIGFYNSTLEDLERVKEPRYSQDLSACFPWPNEEIEVYKALLVSKSDNDTAREVKGEYRRLLNEIKKDRAQAEKMLERLGEGTHRLSNGDVVHITRDDAGNVQVQIDKPDGSSKKISYNQNVPGDARIENTSADVATSVSERKGQSVSKTADRVESTYSLDSEGRPVKEKRGPGYDDYARTTVNKDGSTDTRELIYYSDEVEEGEDPGVYEDTHEPSRRTGKYQDAGAGRAIDELKARNPKKITADMMEKLILDATSDADNQAAGKEYADLKKFVTENWGKLSAEARKVWQVYERYVYDAKAKGQTGIDLKDYEAMKLEMAGSKVPKYRDAGAGKAIEALKATNPDRITPEMMQKLIVNATSDPDNQAAGKEYEDLEKFVSENGHKLTPEAKQVWQIYEKYVQAAKAKGQTGIESTEYRKMVGEMKRPGYQDKGAGEAIDRLKQENPSEITDDRMVALILQAIADPDNQAAGKEYEDLKKFVTESWSKLTPEAKAKWQVYERFVYDAKAQGQTGLSPQNFIRMVAELVG